MSLESQKGSQKPTAEHQRTPIVTSSEQQSLMDVWRVLMKQRFTILAVMAISFIGSVIYSYRTKPIYESVSRVQIRPEARTKIGLQGLEEGAGGSAGATVLKTEVLILQSDRVMLDTAKALNVFAKVHAGNKQAGGPSEAELTPAERRAAIGTVRSGLTVRMLPDTEVLEVHCRGTDPKMTTAIVNQLLDTYIDDNLRSKFERTQYVSVWLQKQLDGLRKDAEDAQYRLADFEKQHNIVGQDEKSNLTMQSLMQTSQMLGATETERILKEARVRERETLLR